MRKKSKNLVNPLFFNALVLSGLLSIGCVGSDYASTFRKGPYLIYGGINTEMTVLWQTDGSSIDTVRWGRNAGLSEGIEINHEYGNHQHKQILAGLSPGVKYYYQVKTGDDVYGGSFRAAPDSEATSLKFIAYGDTRINKRAGGDSVRTGPFVHDRIAHLIDSTFAADNDYQTLALESGDLVLDGNDDTLWQRDFFDHRWSNIQAMIGNLPLQACMGNHEGNGKLFQQYFPYPFVADRYWSFDYGPAHFSVIDQFNAGSNDSNSERINWLDSTFSQFKWLEQDLRSSKKPWKILVFHEPGWSADGNPVKSGHRRKGKGHTNNEDVQTYIEPLCEKYGVHLVIAGHNHFYSRATVMTSSGDSVIHITTGGGGAPLYDSIAASPNVVAFTKTNHFCKVNIVSPTLLEMEVISAAGEVIDKFTINRNR